MTSTELRHADYCMPRPGEDAPRVEIYTATRDDDQGHPVATVRVARCMECAAATYDGVPE